MIRNLRSREFYILAAVFACLSALWGFVEIADEVDDGDEIQAFDHALLTLFRTGGDFQPVGPEWMPHAIRDVSALGGHTVLTLVVILAAGYCAIVRRFSLSWLVLASAAGGTIASSSMKELFARARPDAVPHLTEVSTASFPSGHAMLSTAVYVSIAAIIAQTLQSHGARIYVIGAALLLSGLVGISRIYLGVHYPSDVLGGWAAGLAWALMCWLLAVYLQWRRKI